jgi:hypothetical protein
MRGLYLSYCDKNRIPPEATFNFDAFWEAVLTTVPGNRITTVPKGRLIDRPIAVEPTLNMMLQLGVEGFIRKRLKRWGINLDSQRKNQVLAYTGSLSDDSMSPVTIDLASASDTISLRICKVLLPACWYEYMCALRSPEGELPDGSTITYRKVSSMGNGATFALESAVFASIVYASCKAVLGYYPRQLVGVYGDDLIVPKCVSLKLTQMLEMAGFLLNTDKSFLSGPARESCGADWFRGHDVRGVFIKKSPSHVDELFCDRNRIFSWLHRHGYRDTTALDDLFQRWTPEWLRGIIGPPTIKDYSSYWHSVIPPQDSDESGQIPIRRIVCRVGRKDATNFELGQLSLQFGKRPTAIQPWEKQLASGGRADDLPGPQVRRSITRSICYDWQIGYSTGLDNL